MELYIHLPFCKSKCRYCDFASWPGLEGQMPAYVDAVLAEASARAEELGAVPIRTVYIGGGTPSLLPPELLRRLLGGLKERLCLAQVCELTSEANPGTLTPAWLDAAMEGGVTRLSMGMQAAQSALLKTLGRIHRFEDVEQSVALARSRGLENISLDLMFGLPGQTPAMWRDSLEAALSLHPKHLSCYGLIPEDGTPLKAALDAGEESLPPEEEEREMYDLAVRRLAAGGFRQYEISNFALEGCECLHNIGYWQQVPYLGLGAAAASMLVDGERPLRYHRETNPGTLDEYAAMVRRREWHRRDVDSVPPRDARFETMMLGLRMTEGVQEARFEQLHGMTLEGCYGQKLRETAAHGLTEYASGRWYLTRAGMDVQNAVLVELMD